MRLAPVVLAVLCALVLFTGLDRIGFTDWREARDAEVAREMIGRRELLSPLYAHEALFEKPVFAYVPEVAATLLGHGAPDAPMRSRLWRAGLAAALVLLTFSIGAEHFGTRAGWTAAIVLVTTLALPHAARTDGTQLLGTFLGWVGAAGFADALHGRARGRALRLVVAWGALAAALVAAGPLPALWPLGALLLYAALARHPGGVREVQPVAGLLLMAGIALPWYGAMVDRHGLAFGSRVMGFPYGVETPGPWFAGPLLALSFLVVGLFPWTALLPDALRHAATSWRRAHPDAPPGAVPMPGDPLARERREESAAHFFVACLVVACVPVALYPGPPLTAMLPALPAGALLCGRLLDHLDESPQRLAGAIGRATLTLALTGTVAGVLFAVMAGRLPNAASELRLLGAVVFAASWAPFLASFMGRRRLAAALIALPVAVGAPIVALTLSPALEEVLNTRAVAEALRATAPERSPLVLVEPARPSLRLYARRDLVVVPSLAAPLDVWRGRDSLVYAAFRPGLEHQVARSAAGPIEIVLRTPTLVLARLHPGR